MCIQTIKTLVIVSLFANSISAQAGSTFSVFGIGDFSSFGYSTAQRANATPDTKLGVGAGAQFEVHLITKNGVTLGLEAGANVVRRQFYFSDPAVPIHYQLSSPAVQVPVQLKSWLLSFLSVGFGAYYTMGVGDLLVRDSSNEASVQNGTRTYASQGLKKSDFGIIGGIGLNLPLGLLSILAEARITMGLTDLNSPSISGLTTKSQSFQALVGVRFGKLH
jgi:hypothetical protein